MVTELPRRTSFSGPTLVRLLSRLAQVEVAEPRQSPAARLDEWLGWTESILLSKVLNAAVSSSAAKESDAGDAIVDINELAQAEYSQLRVALEQAIAGSVAPPVAVSAMQRRQFRGSPSVVADTDFPSYRRRYTMVQQKMETSIADLRGRMRRLLALQGPGLAHLAAMDAAMEQALVGHELRLLASVPRLLEGHFERLKRSDQAPANEVHEAQTQNNQSPPSGQRPSAQQNHWLDTFRSDMGQVMRAELELRLQPIQGLLAAISTEQNTL